MVYSSVHEFADRPDAYVRQLGYCNILLMVLGSANCNPQFVVRIYKTGFVRTVDSNDVILFGNPMYEEDCLIPPIPEKWLLEEDKGKYPIR